MVPELEFSEMSAVARLSETDFARCATGIVQSLRQASPTVNGDYGVFRISISGSPRIVNTFAKPEVLNLLGLFPKNVLQRNPELSRAIDGLKRALGAI